MFRKVKVLLAAALAAAVTFSLAGCYGDTNEWALEINGEQIPSGVYLTYLVDHYRSALGKLQEEDSAVTADSMWDKKIEDTDTTTYIINKAIEGCTQYIAVERQFEELGLSLSSDDKSTINSTTDNIWSQSQNVYEKNGASKASIRKVIENSQKSHLVFMKYYDKEGLEAVAEEEIKTHFIDLYAKIKLGSASLLNTTTYQALSDEEKKKLLDKFNAYADRVRGGEDIDTVLDEYAAELNASEESSNTSESSSSEEATSSESTSAQTSDASQSQSETSASEESSEESSINPDRYTVMLSKEDTQYPEELITKIFEMKNGDVASFEIPNFAILAQRFSLEDDTKSYETYRVVTLLDLKQDAFTAKLAEVSKDYAVKQNESAINRFSPKNIPGRIEKTSTAA